MNISIYVITVQIVIPCKAANATVKEVEVLGFLYVNVILQILTLNVQLKKAQ